MPEPDQFVREVHVASTFNPEPLPGVGATFSLGKHENGRVYVRVFAWAEMTHQIRDLPLHEFLRDGFYPEDIRDQIRAVAESDPTWVWSYPPELVRLAEALSEKENVADEELASLVRATYWGTNCSSWVEMSLAIVSAVCALRPQLAEELIVDPIDVMIQGGLDSEDDVIAQGVALARKSDPYVPLTTAGRAWLVESWPRLEQQARAIFRRKLAELNE